MAAPSRRSSPETSRWIASGKTRQGMGLPAMPRVLQTRQGTGLRAMPPTEPHRRISRIRLSS
jgi:hypothetical protein